MRKSMTFNGVRKPWLHLLQGRSKSPFAPVKNNLIKVNGMPGAYVGSKEIDVLYITQPVGFIVENDEHALQLKDELAEWLLTDEAVPLQFDDEPGRTYFAEIEGTIEDFNKFVDQRSGIITFLCADSFSYGEEKEFIIEPEAAAIVDNKGTAAAKPIFEMEVNEPITFAMISNGDEYNMIGAPIDVDDVTYKRLETVLNDNCSSLTGWTALVSGTELDTGVVGGKMIVQGGYAFTAENYGTNANGWVGPAVKRALPDTLQDFRVEIQIGAFNTSGEVGTLELHLLDESDNTIAVLAMRDSSANLKENRAVIQLGQSGDRHKLVDYNGGYLATWNDFSGIIRLEREGDEFRAYVAVVDDKGNHIRRYNLPNAFVDTLGRYQAKLAQIVVYDAKAKNYEPYRKLMNNIYVGKINQEVGIPYIADAGDIITLDNVTNNILINGESIFGNGDLDVFYPPGSSFFDLKPGENTLTTLPDGSLRTIARYRERYR